MAKTGRSPKTSWFSDLVPIGLAMVVVAAAAIGFRLMYSGEKAATKEAFVDAQKDAFLKQHYPLDLSSAKEPTRTAPAPASSR